MTLAFKVSGRIARQHDVFEAVADPDQLSRYFTTNGAKGRLETGATWCGTSPTSPVRSLSTWQGRAGSSDRAAMAGRRQRGQALRNERDDRIRALDDGRTLVTIAEEGWRDTEAAQQASYGNCEGWTGMLCAMKVWLEHRINLRDGFYK